MAKHDVGFLYSMTWAASLAFAQLAFRQRTPIRLMRFLEDARDRNALRSALISANSGSYRGFACWLACTGCGSPRPPGVAVEPTAGFGGTGGTIVRFDETVAGRE